MSTLKPNPVRDRILEVASGLFYHEGIRTVGVDRVIAESGIAKATLYRHFPGKEDLIVAYLQQRHAGVVRALDKGLPSADTPWQTRILAVFQLLHRKADSADFRGCAFMLAVAENEASQRVRSVAQQHKQAVRDLFLGMLPSHWATRDAVAAQLNLLYDGALAQIMIHRDPTAALMAADVAELLLDAKEVQTC